MFRNYIIVALRSVYRNRLFSLINVAGLALSMSVCMIVMVRIMDSFSYDNFHKDKERIFRIISEVKSNKGGRWDFASTPLPLHEKLAEHSPLFESITQLYPSIRDIVSTEQMEVEVAGAFAERSFFSIFSFPFKYGKPSEALSQPFSMVLSEKLATQIFGNVDPCGKMIKLQTLGLFTVTGILQPTNDKSHLNFSAYASMSTVPILETTGQLPAKYGDWDTFEMGYTYVKLDEQTAEQSLTNLLKSISSEINQASEDGTFNLHAQALGSITPGISDMIHETGRGPTRGSLLAEVGIAMIILVAAAFNYTNLSVARGLSRGKEVGIRKLSGAKRYQIFTQYIFESIVLALLAFLFSNVIFALILEYKPFNDGYEMVPAIRPGLTVFLTFLTFAVFAGMVSGAMPAWILSSFQPARIFRNVGSEKVFGNLSGRKLLMVFQFSLSLVILVFLSAFNQQFDFLESADPGFHSDNQLSIPSAGKKQQIEQRLGQIKGVENVGFTSNTFANRNSSIWKGSLRPFDERPLAFNAYSCNASFLRMAKIEVISGHLFQNDENRIDQIVVNEKAVQALGLKSPHEALGQIVFFDDSARATIIGVVRDFYDNGYGNPIQPLAIRQDPRAFRFTVVEATPSQLLIAANSIKDAWREIYPDQVFEFSWLDKKKKADVEGSATFTLLSFLSLITITIASMGLLGLVVYTTEVRRKEMSIRKIIGARVDQIIVLLSRGFVKLLFIAGLIALPIGYGLSEWFLMNFVNRISFGPLDLFISFVSLLAIGLAIILPQTWLVSNENPGQNLRSD